MQEDSETKKAPIPLQGMDAENNRTNAYWLVVVVPPAGAFVSSGGEVWSSCGAQPTSSVETAAIKNNNFFIRYP